VFALIYQRYGCGLNLTYDDVMAMPLDEIALFATELDEHRANDVKALGKMLGGR
jgi:hypothetical protein